MSTVTWDLITTKNLEIRKRRGLMITMVVLIVLPTVLIYGFRLLFHAIDPNTYAPAGQPGLFSQITDLTAEFGFFAAAALGASAGTTDLSDGMFRHLVITGRSRLQLYLARIPAGLAIIVPLVALAFLMNCLVTNYEGSPNPTTVPLYGLSVPQHLDQSGLQTWLIDHPQQDANNLPLPGISPTSAAAQIDPAIDKNIDRLYPQYVNNEFSSSNPADNEMVKIGLWLELDIGIAFLVGLGIGSLTGQRTTTTILLIALEIIVTPLLGRVQLPYFIDGQRLLIGIAMDQLRPIGLAAGNGGGGGPGQLLFGGQGGLTIPAMPTWAMISVIVGWIVVFSGLGAWRMMTRDALPRYQPRVAGTM
jgi:ABC-type transport system involved in multi-copper enzyme maturation permease subunit